MNIIILARRLENFPITNEFSSDTLTFLDGFPVFRQHNLIRFRSCSFVNYVYQKPLGDPFAWPSYQIRGLWVVHAPGMKWTFSPPLLQRKPLVSEFGMHVSWCMLGSITRGGGENVPDIPSVCVTRNFTYQARGPWRLNVEVVFGKVHNIFYYDQRMYFMCSKCVEIPCIWFALQDLRFAN